MFGFLKGLRLVKGVKVAKAATNVTKVSKLGIALKELPVVKIIAGSAVGVVIIDWWNSSKTSLSETLGITENESQLMMIVIIAAGLALLVSLIFRRRN